MLRWDVSRLVGSMSMIGDITLVTLVVLLGMGRSMVATV